MTYREMCDAENVQTLQRGMNFRLNPGYSVILMSQRKNAPYEDEILDDGLTLVYEGHDVPKTPDTMNPKAVDQRERTRMGRLTQNGRFTRAVRNYKKGKAAEKVRVYEKLFDGVWSFKGLFDLIDYGYVKQKVRHVFKFTLRLSSVESTPPHISVGNRTRVIPTHIKKVVWQRDRGRCVVCGARDELHFDHDIPFSKGGSSVSADNVRILCARHNLEKGNKIE